MSDRKTRPVSIEGKITCADGEEVQFLITGDGGWHQWGNVEEVLYRTVPMMDALAPAAMEFLPSDSEPDEEEATCRHCGRRIINDPDEGWIDPKAGYDDEFGDGIWRTTCDSHDTFTAEHEPEEES